MPQRLNYKALAPEAHKAMLALSAVVAGSGLEAALCQLVKLRVSQINGCAYCCWLHAKDLRALGENPARLDCLAAWREAPCYTARERAALDWAEAVTQIGHGHAPDEVYRVVLAQFSEAHVVALTYLVAEINAWNRLAIPFRAEPPKA
ncbi:MAG: carboxymuconolactone decarboxylase family protein [Alphaproteobacteria bacterium]